MSAPAPALPKRLDGWPVFWGILILTAAFVACMVSAAPPTWRAALLAFTCGASVGLAEIVSRYRDEPLNAALSPFGLVYLFFNGFLAIGMLAVALKYRTQLNLPDTLDSFWAALLAGFGSTALMRTRLAVIRGTDNKDISLGPDIVVKTLLQMVDQYIDRDRASRRLGIVLMHLGKIAELGLGATAQTPFAQAADYMLASLLAFQSLDDERRTQLKNTMTAYDQQTKMPDQIKYFALGFVFLTLVGERQFADVVSNAVITKSAGRPAAAETN